MRTDAVMFTLILALSAVVVPGARADFFKAKQGWDLMRTFFFCLVKKDVNVEYIW